MYIRKQTTLENPNLLL